MSMIRLRVNNYSCDNNSVRFFDGNDFVIEVPAKEGEMLINMISKYDKIYIEKRYNGGDWRYYFNNKELDVL